MGMSEMFLNWMFGIKSPSKYFETYAIENIVKPMKKGIKIAEKEVKKYKRDCAKFKQKWLKQNKGWKDTRQKKKALEKAFLKEFPHHKFYIKLERLVIKCMI